MPPGAWCVSWSFGLDYMYVFKSCLIWVVCFAKQILCHNVDSLNAPRDAPRHEYCKFKWARTMITCVSPFFCSLKKKKHIKLINMIYFKWNCYQFFSQKNCSKLFIINYNVWVLINTLTYKMYICHVTYNNFVFMLLSNFN